MPEVSIVILNWNGKDDTEECLRSIYKSDFRDFEAVVVDNKSSDGSVEFLKDRFPRRIYKNLKIVENARNSGLAEGFNIGLKHCSGKLVCWLNNDTVVDKKWLSELVKAVKSDEGIALAGSRINNIEAYGSKETCGAILNVFFQVVDAEKKDTETSFAPGCSFIMKKKLFENAPLIPEYFGNCEDVYLSMLARLKGHSIVMAPKSYLLHKGGASVKKISDFMAFHMEKNIILNFLILYKASTVFLLMPFFLAMHFFNLIAAVFTGSLKRKLRVYWWVLANMNVVFRNRKIVRKQRRISDRQLIASSMSLRFPSENIFGKAFGLVLKFYMMVFGFKARY